MSPGRKTGSERLGGETPGAKHPDPDWTTYAVAIEIKKNCNFFFYFLMALYTLFTDLTFLATNIDLHCMIYVSHRKF